MKVNFVRSLARVLVYEGGLVNNPKDPGGLTNKGITQGTYASWRARQGQPAASVAGISEHDVEAIYKADYWDRAFGDELPSGIDFCIFDAAVNSGVGAAASWAQAVLGLRIDGDIGPKTKAALLDADPEDFITKFCAHRLGSLERLRTWSTFGKGWHARISNVQKTALAWAESGDANTGPDAVQVVMRGGHHKAPMEAIPDNKISQVVAHASTVGGVLGTAAAQTGQALSPASDAFPWLKYILGGLTVLGALGGLMVYLSKQANDAASDGVRTAKVDPDADSNLPTVAIPKDTVSIPVPVAPKVAANG